MKGEKYLIKSVFVEIMKAKNIYIYQAYILILIDYITNLMNYSTRTEPFIFVQYKGCSDMEIWIVRFLFFLTNENIEKGNLSLLTSFKWRKWIFRSHLILDEITFKFQFYKFTQLHWTGHVPIMYENQPQSPYWMASDQRTGEKHERYSGRYSLKKIPSFLIYFDDKS